MKAALDAAQVGDEILLDPSGSWSVIALPQRPGNGWITIRCDGCSLPPYGERLTEAQVAGLPVIRTSSAPALDGATTSGWWITGISFIQPPGVFADAIVRFRGGADISLDRIHVRGNNNPTDGTKRCVLGNSAWIQVIGSRLEKCNRRGQDAQAFIAWESPGPVRVHNNFLQGSGETVFIGGADPSSAERIVSDVEITENHFYWDFEDRGKFSFKNHLEFKTGRRVLVEGNLFENYWTGTSSQFYTIVIKGVDQGGNTNPDCPHCLTEDITFRGNTLRNVAAGIHICPSCESGPGQPAYLRRVTIEGNDVEINQALADGLRREFLGLTGKTWFGSDFYVANNNVTGANAWMHADHGNEPHQGDRAVCGWAQENNSSSTSKFVGRSAKTPDHFLSGPDCFYVYETP